MQAAHDLRSRRAFELALELVEQRVAVAGRLVAEIVHEPSEPVDGTKVRTGEARRQEGDDREVLTGSPLVDPGRGELGSVE